MGKKSVYKRGGGATSSVLYAISILSPKDVVKEEYTLEDNIQQVRNYCVNVYRGFYDDIKNNPQSKEIASNILNFILSATDYNNRDLYPMAYTRIGMTSFSHFPEGLGNLQKMVHLFNAEMESALLINGIEIHENIIGEPVHTVIFDPTLPVAENVEVPVAEPFPEGSGRKIDSRNVPYKHL